MTIIKFVKVVDIFRNELKAGIKPTSAAIGTAKKTGLCTAFSIEIPCRSGRVCSLHFFSLVIRFIFKLAGVAEHDYIAVYRLIRLTFAVRENTSRALSEIKSVKVVDTLCNELKAGIKPTFATTETTEQTGLCTASSTEKQCRSGRIFFNSSGYIQGHIQARRCSGTLSCRCLRACTMNSCSSGKPRSRCTSTPNLVRNQIRKGC